MYIVSKKSWNSVQNIDPKVGKKLISTISTDYIFSVTRVKFRTFLLNTKNVVKICQFRCIVGTPLQKGFNVKCHVLKYTKLEGTFETCHLYSEPCFKHSK